MQATINRLRQLAYNGYSYHRWYDALLADITIVCQDRGWNLDREVDLFAALSPRCTVTANAIRWLSISLGRGMPRDVPRGIAKQVIHVLQGNRPYSPKVLAFANAIRGDRLSIALDSHMARAMNCDPSLFSQQSHRMLADRLVRSAAHYVGLSPRDTQAAIWAGQLLSSGRNVPQPNIVGIYRSMAR